MDVAPRSDGLDEVPQDRRPPEVLHEPAERRIATLTRPLDARFVEPHRDVSALVQSLGEPDVVGMGVGQDTGRDVRPVVAQGIEALEQLFRMGGQARIDDGELVGPFDEIPVDALASAPMYAIGDLGRWFEWCHSRVTTCGVRSGGSSLTPIAARRTLATRFEGEDVNRYHISGYRDDAAIHARPAFGALFPTATDWVTTGRIEYEAWKRLRTFSIIGNSLRFSGIPSSHSPDWDLYLLVDGWLGFGPTDASDDPRTVGLSTCHTIPGRNSEVGGFSIMITRTRASLSFPFVWALRIRRARYQLKKSVPRGLGPSVCGNSKSPPTAIDQGTSRISSVRSKNRRPRSARPPVASVW